MAACGAETAMASGMSRGTTLQTMRTQRLLD
jgi:hypothetical protein